MLIYGHCFHIVGVLSCFVIYHFVFPEILISTRTAGSVGAEAPRPHAQSLPRPNSGGACGVHAGAGEGAHTPHLACEEDTHGRHELIP